MASQAGTVMLMGVPRVYSPTHSPTACAAITTAAKMRAMRMSMGRLEKIRASCMFSLASHTQIAYIYLNRNGQTPSRR